jgi:hypothetical protein
MVYAVFAICPVVLTDRTIPNSPDTQTKTAPNGCRFYYPDAAYFLMRITGVSPTVT